MNTCFCKQSDYTHKCPQTSRLCTYALGMSRLSRHVPANDFIRNASLANYSIPGLEVTFAPKKNKEMIIMLRVKDKLRDR